MQGLRSWILLVAVCVFAQVGTGCIFLDDDEECCDEYGCYDCSTGWVDTSGGWTADVYCGSDAECGPGCVCLDNLCVSHPGYCQYDSECNHPLFVW